MAANVYSPAQIDEAAFIVVRVYGQSNIEYDVESISIYAIKIF